MSSVHQFSQYDGVLLMAYGGPATAEQVRPFLHSLFGGRFVYEERLQEIEYRYQLIGGYSPLIQATERQAQALRNQLALVGINVAVYLAMRAGSPSIREALEKCVASGSRRLLAIVLTPFESEFSHGRYRAGLSAALQLLGSKAPLVEYAQSFYASQGFIRANADRAIEALAGLTPQQRERAALIFTAHSIPAAAERAEVYEEQIRQSAGRIAEVTGKPDFRVAYQSRTGPAEQAWLEPSVAEVIEQETARGATQLVVVPVGFVCDNLEVLYDIDIEAAEVARGLGATLHRCGTIGDHPAFIEALVDLCRSRLAPCPPES